jgi:hypothetical protein
VAGKRILDGLNYSSILTAATASVNFYSWIFYWIGRSTVFCTVSFWYTKNIKDDSTYYPTTAHHISSSFLQLFPISQWPKP